MNAATAHKTITLRAAEFDLIASGVKTQLRFPLDQQPPANFRKGDLAAVTNGVQWAISNSGWGSGYRGAWPADPLPGVDCPYGLAGTMLELAYEDGRRAAVELVHCRLELLHHISEEGAAAEGASVLEITYSHPTACVLDDLGVSGPCRRYGFAKEWIEKYGLDNAETSWRKNPWVWRLKFAAGTIPAL